VRHEHTVGCPIFDLLQWTEACRISLPFFFETRGESYHSAELTNTAEERPRGRARVLRSVVTVRITASGEAIMTIVPRFPAVPSTLMAVRVCHKQIKKVKSHRGNGKIIQMQVVWERITSKLAQVPAIAARPTAVQVCSNTKKQSRHNTFLTCSSQFVCSQRIWCILCKYAPVIGT